jgi:hypothetical protein
MHYGLEVSPLNNSRSKVALAVGPLEHGDTKHPCLMCETPMIRLISAPDIREGVAVSLMLHWCPECKPTEADGSSSKISWSQQTWTWDKLGIAFESQRIPLEEDDAFTSRIGGRPLLMDASAPMPWEDGDDTRPWRHVLSLVDHPDVGFDPTGYPLVIVASEDDSELYTWVADGR